MNVDLPEPDGPGERDELAGIASQRDAAQRGHVDLADVIRLRQVANEKRVVAHRRPRRCRQRCRPAGAAPPPNRRPCGISGDPLVPRPLPPSAWTRRSRRACPASDRHRSTAVCVPSLIPTWTGTRFTCSRETHTAARSLRGRHVADAAISAAPADPAPSHPAGRWTPFGWLLAERLERYPPSDGIGAPHSGPSSRRRHAPSRW